MRQDFVPAPGLVSNDTTFAAAGRWAAGSNVRFWEGKAQTIPGWQSMAPTLLTGVCRKVFPWTDVPGQLNIGFGTHSKLQVWYGGVHYDITPFIPPTTLGANPLAVTNTSPVVTVTHTAHGLATGNTVIISGSTAVGGITPNGTFPITVIDANTYSYTFTSSATSTAAGGGSAVVITPQVLLPAGQIDGTGTSGYSTGGYSVGGYSSPSTADYFPRTWSLAAWGGQLLASPRGGTIYLWTNDLTSKAAALANAPAQVTQMLVAPNAGGFQVFALGCSQEVGGVFNPMCIRHSSVRINTEWNTDLSTTAREYVLTGGGRIVGGLMLGDQLLVWTNKALFVGVFIGSLNQPWQFTQVAEKCGLIGPNAAVILGEAAYWMSPDRQFWRCYMGGAPQPVDCPIREDFEDNLAFSQNDKIVAASCAKYNEVSWDYPDAREGYENSRRLSLCVAGQDAGAWSAGLIARTAAVDAAPADFPIGVTYQGNCYWQESGASADGGQLAAYLQSADLYLDDDTIMEVSGIWPDFTDQLGVVSLTLTARMYPQGPTTSVGPLAMAPGAQKIDCRLTGRLFNVRLDSNASPSEWRLGKLSFECQPTGSMR